MFVENILANMMPTASFTVWSVYWFSRLFPEGFSVLINPVFANHNYGKPQYVVFMKQAVYPLFLLFHLASYDNKTLNSGGTLLSCFILILRNFASQLTWKKL